MNDEERIFESNDEQPDDLSKWDTPPNRLEQMRELISLSRIPASEVPQVQDVSDKKALGEENSFALAKQQAELDKLKADIKGLEQDTEQRKAYAGRIFWLNVVWITSLTAIVLLSGFQWTHFLLPVSVLLALVGTTTLNILGTLYIVAQYLFPKRR